MSFSKLRGKIREVFGTQDKCAEAMEMNTSTLSAKLCGKTSWKREEIEKMCLLLSIPFEDTHIYFF